MLLKRLCRYSPFILVKRRFPSSKPWFPRVLAQFQLPNETPLARPSLVNELFGVTRTLGCVMNMMIRSINQSLIDKKHIF